MSTTAPYQTTALAVKTPAYLPAVSPDAIEQAMAIGDLSKMTNEVRVAYYVATCQSAGLNPMTRPFDLIKGDDGTVRLYPNKVAAEQLRKMYRVSQKVIERRMDVENGLYIVTVQASLPDGREDEAQGIVDIFQKKGMALANCLMRAETKAKRRATLSLCGLGYEDSEDVGGHPVRFDYQQGAMPDETRAHATPARETATLRQLSDDLYGEARDIPNFAQQPPVLASTPSAVRVDTPPPAPDDAEAKNAIVTLDVIDQVVRATMPETPESASLDYWARTCKRCKVGKPEDIKASWLPELLREVEARYAKVQAAHAHERAVQAQALHDTLTGEGLGDWRPPLTALLSTFRGDDTLLSEMYEAVNDASTPDDIGRSVLARAQAYMMEHSADLPA